jgi:hypothetical protein
MITVEVNQTVDQLVADPDIERWLDTRFKFSPHTQRISRNAFEAWYSWLQVNGPREIRGLSPGGLADYQEQVNRSTGRLDRANKYLILNSVLDFIRCHEEWRTGYRVKVLQGIKSFFDSWGCELPKLDKASKGCLKGVVNLKVRKLLTNEIAREVITASDPAHRAIYSMMAVSGMGLAEIVWWSDRGGPHDRLKVDGQELLEIPVRSRKGNVDSEFYTYVGGSALRFFDEWMKIRAMKYPDAKAVFLAKSGEPVESLHLSMYWVAKLRQLGIYKPPANSGHHQRSGMNAHQLRSLFRTNWSESGAKQQVGEFCLGHKLDPLDYDQFAAKQSNRTKQYLKALPNLDFFKLREPDAEVGSLKDRMAELEKLVERLSTENKTMTLLMYGNKLLNEGDEFKDVKAKLKRMMEDIRAGREPSV